MTAHLTLKIDITSYWHPGTGKGSGSHVDAIVERDRFGCPFIAGTMLRGLLRDSVYRASEWGHFDPLIDLGDPSLLVTHLFGTRSDTGDGTDRYHSRSGLIRVSDATLEESLRRWLGGAHQQSKREALFTDIYATAIDSDTGVARQGSLRGIQVVVPVPLYAQLSFTNALSASPDADYDVEQVLTHAWAIIERSLPLLTCVGAMRTRGFGRAQVSIIDGEAA